MEIALTKEEFGKLLPKVLETLQSAGYQVDTGDTIESGRVERLCVRLWKRDMRQLDRLSNAVDEAANLRKLGKPIPAKLRRLMANTEPLLRRCQ